MCYIQTNIFVSYNLMVMQNIDVIKTVDILSDNIYIKVLIDALPILEFSVLCIDNFH